MAVTELIYHLNDHIIKIRHMEYIFTNFRYYHTPKSMTVLHELPKNNSNNWIDGGPKVVKKSTNKGCFPVDRHCY